MNAIAAKFDLSLVTDADLEAERTRRQVAAVKAAEAPIEVDGHWWYVMPHHVLRADIDCGQPKRSHFCSHEGRAISAEDVRALIRGESSKLGGQPYIPFRYKRLAELSESVTLERGLAVCRLRGEVIAVVGLLRADADPSDAIPVVPALA